MSVSSHSPSADASEFDEEDACLSTKSSSAQQAALSGMRVDWVALLITALLITAGVLSYYGSALQQLAAAHGSAESTTSAAPRPAAVDFQAWVLDTLQPLPPRRLPDADPRIAVEEDGVRRFRQGGENYAMGSLSSRLQRLPLLTEWTDEACRFPYNPSILERRSPAGLPHAATAGSSTGRSYDFHLSTQLGSYAMWRRPEGSETWYLADPWDFKTCHVLQRLIITRSPHGAFQLSVSDARKWNITFTMELRLLHHNHSVLAYDNRQLAYIVPLQGGEIVINDGSSQRQFKALDDRVAKNFMAASVDGQLYYVQRFSPFILVSCGTDDVVSDCRLQSQRSLENSLLPELHTHWRGSTTLLPLPTHPHLLLGVVHERTTSGRNKSRDIYYHRFVLVDSHRWVPFAFTDNFALFAHIEAQRWFEFIMSFGYLGTSDLALTFGYNDQEPWMAFLPLHGVLRALQPVFAWQAEELASVQAHRAYSEQRKPR